jgi:DNA/RNA endonuclease YhcR with UshA esterase domain
MRSCLVLLCLLAPAAWAADKKDEKPLTPAEAVKKVGDKVTVELKVQSSAASKSGVVFLNSEKDFKDKKNLTIFLSKDAVAKFKHAKIENPAEYYKGKTIRVSGKVELYNKRPEIKVAGPDDVKVVEK